MTSKNYANLGFLSWKLHNLFCTTELPHKNESKPNLNILKFETIYYSFIGTAKATCVLNNFFSIGKSTNFVVSCLKLHNPIFTFCLKKKNRSETKWNMSSPFYK